MTSKVINFFSTKTVQERILTNSLSQGQIFLYFYIIFMYDTIGFVQQWLSIAGKQPTIDNLVTTWGYLFFSAIGLIILFVANGATKGKNFLPKVFAFSVTVGFKYAILLLILELLPNFIPMFAVPAYEIFIFIFMNTLMMFNIAFRIYQTSELPLV